MIELIVTKSIISGIGTKTNRSVSFFKLLFYTLTGLIEGV